MSCSNENLYFLFKSWIKFQGKIWVRKKNAFFSPVGFVELIEFEILLIQK